MALNSFIRTEIERKAKAGEKLSNPTAESMAYYSKFATPVAKAPVAKAPVNNTPVVATKTVVTPKPVVNPVSKTPVATTYISPTKMTNEQKSYVDMFKKALESGKADVSQLQRYNAINNRYGLGKEMNAEQVGYMNNYNTAIANGQNDLTGLNRYNAISSRYGLKPTAKVNDAAMQDLSIKALSGDSKAAEYLKAMKLNPKTGEALWNGFDVSKLDSNELLKNAYLKDNPFADYTRNYDMSQYELFNSLLENGGAISDEQLASYNDITKKWNLENLNDPYVRNRKELEAMMEELLSSQDGQYEQFMNMMNGQLSQFEADKMAALNGQDVALNQGLGAQSANNFQQFQQLQEMMAGRGMSDSGIAADTYMRANMGANQNYQQAFADSANTKADIQSRYNNAISNTRMQGQEALANMNSAKNDILSKFGSAIGNTRMGQLEYQNAQRDYADKQASDNQKAQMDLIKLQSDQDKYLTESTGMVYLGGKPLTNGGKVVTSLEYRKMSETQRHNLATENMTAVKNAQDYELGKDKNVISREKLAAEIAQNIAKNKLEYSKLDFNYAKLESTNAYNQDRIGILAQNAQTSVDKNQLTALGKQSDQLAKQIIEAQKKGKKPDKAIVDKYNSINNQISQIVGGSDFNSEKGGGDKPTSLNNLPSGSYNNWRMYGKQPSTFSNHLTKAIEKGVPFAEAKALTELVGRESSWNPNAKNPSSSAHGYAQFLNSTKENYEKRYPNLDYENPVDQLVLMYNYIKDRYGSVDKALKFWDENKYY